MMQLSLGRSITLVCLFLASSVQAQNTERPAIAPAEANGHRSIQVDRPLKPGDEISTFARHFGVDWVAVDEVRLPAVDHNALLREDKQFDPMPLRFAIPRNVGIEAAHGRWIEVEGGWLWRVLVRSEGAENIRAHVTDMALPTGGEIRIHAPSMPLDIAGPYREDGPFRNGEAWGITAPGESFVVEYFTQENPVDVLPFDVSELYHGYRDIFAEEEPMGGTAGAGSCHNDPLCYSDWSDVSNAVCRLYFQGYVCSGQLTATSSEDETPLITTANHCIGNSSEAASCEFRFKYRRTSCSGGIYSGISSNGSTLLDTYSTSDNSLLMIEDELPTDVFFIGWTTAAISTGTDVVCIHHPAGDYQRISFGDKISNGVCGSSNYWYGVQWNDGVTEGGSSGSFLARESDQKLVGVLTCGASACSNTNGADGYGRFDKAYTNGGFSAFMQEGTDDTLEDSDSCANARELEPGSWSNLVVKSTDEDWYSFDVANGSELDIHLDFIDGNGDIDGQLFSSCGGSVLVNATTNNNDENISYTNNSGATQTYILRVFLYSDTRNGYSMTADFTEGSSDPPPTNDLCNNALAMSNGVVPFTTVAATSNGPDAPLPCSEDNGPAVYADVWFNYTPDCDGQVTISTCGATFDTRILVYLGESCPGSSTSVYACADNTCGSAETLDILALAGLNYLIRVGSPQPENGSGLLQVSCEPFGNPPANDECANASIISEGTSSFSTLQATNSSPDPPLTCSTTNGPTMYNDVWFLYTPSCTGIATIATCDSNFDTRLLVYTATSCPDSSTPPIGCADDTCGVNASVNLPVFKGLPMLVRIGSPIDAEGDVQLEIICKGAGDPCPEDVTGDGVVDGADLGQMLSQWGGPGSADFNGDNVVDGADLGALLAAWGPC